VQDFPDYAQRWHRVPIQFQNWSETLITESPFTRWLGGNLSLHDPQWTRLLKTPPASGASSLAVTAFEDYVECPLQFYWIKLHGINEENQPELQPDSLIAGQRSHAVAEKLVRGLRNIAIVGSGASVGEENSWLRMFSDLQEKFITADTFLSADPQRWTNGFQNALIQEYFSEVQKTHARVLAEELAESLFSFESKGRDALLTPMKKRLVRETVRRAFKKLVDSELMDAQRTNAAFAAAQDNTKRVGIRAAFIEESVRFEIHPKLILKGQIDRIDSHPAGDSIIDYKTSKVAANEPSLVLSPDGVKAKEKLSVQGAVYSLAWASRLSENEGYEESRGVKSFSLLHLKTLDLAREPYLTCRFSSPLKTQSEEFANLRDVYVKRAAALVEGDFSPRPVTKTLCQWCPFESMCPAAGSVAGERDQA
jgi:ATP-dependent helicase/DNAse subunit B